MLLEPTSYAMILLRGPYEILSHNGCIFSYPNPNTTRVKRYIIWYSFGYKPSQATWQLYNISILLYIRDKLSRTEYAGILSGASNKRV